MTEPSANYPAGNPHFPSGPNVIKATPSSSGPPPSPPTPPPIDLLPYAPPLPPAPLPKRKMEEHGDYPQPLPQPVVLLPGEVPQAVPIPRRGVGTNTRVSVGMTAAGHFPVPKTAETRAQERRLNQAMEDYPLEHMDSTQGPVTMSDANANRQIRYSDAAERVKKALQKGSTPVDPRASSTQLTKPDLNFTRLDYIIVAGLGAVSFAVLFFFWPHIQQALGSLFSPRNAHRVLKASKHVKPAVSSTLKAASKSRVL